MNVLKIHEMDNVVVAIKPLKKGDHIVLSSVVSGMKAASDIQQGHKIAIQPISINENVVKYGMPIGHAVADIAVGEHVHTHNVKTNLAGTLTYDYAPASRNNKTFVDEGLQFRGYKRANGEIGIRNELWILPTVGCISGLGDLLIKELQAEIDVSDIDGIYAFKHPYGCSQLGDDLENTRRILQDLVKHPNTGGVLVFGLGCENNIVKEFERTLGAYDKTRVKFLIAQEIKDEIYEGVVLLKEIYNAMRNDKREDVSVSKLRIGLKCGGSDGFSGITANPLLGLFSDWLIAQGGTTALTEVPEMFGAETILMSRAKDETVFHKIVDLINNFKTYFLRYDQPVFENPSPGNKEGGITTLEDKSLGCIQKGGSETIVDVLEYGERIKTSTGLTLINAPGNDGVSSTALGSSGCHMVLFTTGRGTPLGTFVPTVKVATNSQIAEAKPRWVDFNAGVLLEGVDKQVLLRQFIDLILSVASGQKVNNEKFNFRDITIFKNGVTL